jgi:hypothetical protein
MKRHYYVTFVVGILLSSTPQSTGQQPAQVAQHPSTTKLDIKDAEMSAVFWSRSRDAAYNSSIQISFPSVAEGQRQPSHPETQVWLLKADGTVILPTEKPSTFGIGGVKRVTDSISYAYSHVASAEAVAVVISINGRFFVKPLLADDK